MTWIYLLIGFVIGVVVAMGLDYVNRKRLQRILEREREEDTLARVYVAHEYATERRYAERRAKERRQVERRKRKEARKVDRRKKDRRSTGNRRRDDRRQKEWRERVWMRFRRARLHDPESDASDEPPSTP